MKWKTKPLSKGLGVAPLPQLQVLLVAVNHPFPCLIGNIICL
jgi:hypothetical protein